MLQVDVVVVGAPVVAEDDRGARDRERAVLAQVHAAAGAGARVAGDRSAGHPHRAAAVHADAAAVPGGRVAGDRSSGHLERAAGHADAAAGFLGHVVGDRSAGHLERAAGHVDAAAGLGGAERDPAAGHRERAPRVHVHAAAVFGVAAGDGAPGAVGEREVAAGGDPDRAEEAVGVDQAAVQVERHGVRDHEGNVVRLGGHVACERHDAARVQLRLQRLPRGRGPVGGEELVARGARGDGDGGLRRVRLGGTGRDFAHPFGLVAAPDVVVVQPGGAVVEEERETDGIGGNRNLGFPCAVGVHPCHRVAGDIGPGGVSAGVGSAPVDVDIRDAGEGGGLVVGVELDGRGASLLGSGGEDDEGKVGVGGVVVAARALLRPRPPGEVVAGARRIDERDGAFAGVGRGMVARQRAAVEVVGDGVGDGRRGPRGRRQRGGERRQNDPFRGLHAVFPPGDASPPPFLRGILPHSRPRAQSEKRFRCRRWVFNAKGAKGTQRQQSDFWGLCSGSAPGRRRGNVKSVKR